MGKMIPLLILVIAIEFSLFLFTGSGDTTNSLFNLVFEPTQFFTNTFSLFCSSTTGCSGNSVINIMQTVILGFILIAGISVGTGFVFKQDSVLFASVSAGLGILSILSITKLWVFIYSNAGGAGFANQVIASVICAPLFVVWLIAVLDYIRTPQ